MKFRMCLPLMIAILVFLTGSVQAATITFTSTADFDGGTKGPTVSGNLGVETVTDNPGMAANAFELGNLKGDAYNTADADADTAKWDLTSENAETITRSIAGGVLNVGIETLPLAGWAGIASSVSFSGNAEITWKADAITLTNANDMARMALMDGQGICATGVSQDGVEYDARKDPTASEVRLFAFTCTAGLQTTVGTETADIAEPVWLRITKAGTTVTWSYSTNGVSFVVDESATFATGANLFATITSLDIGDDATQTVWAFDDFRLSGGTVNVGGFRTAGTWTSATQTFTTEIVQGITVTYSGASAAGYIDAIRIVDALGATLFTDDTNIVAGSSIVLIVPDADNLEQDWAARILLAGDGSATTTVESVVITTGDRPCESFGTSTFGIVLFATFGIIAGVAILGAIIYAARVGAEEIDWFAMGGLLIGIVVLLFVVGAFFPVFQSGATLGC